jgi:hypothetical protein
MPAKRGTPPLFDSVPDLRRDWDFQKNSVDPSTLTRGSEQKVWWLCQAGHSWKTKVLNRSLAGHGCPYCSGRVAIAGETDAATLRPQWVAEIDTTKNSSEVLRALKPSSNSKVWFLCAVGHSYEIKLADKERGNGCGVCAGKVVIPGVNDLGTTSPGLLDDWDFEKNAPNLPSAFTSKSGKAFWWTCALGHSQRKSVEKRSRTGCSICSGHRLERGFNDLATTHPRLAAEWDSKKNRLEPFEVRISSREHVWWICGQGHNWNAIVYSRGVSGCPSCAPSGFDSTKPGLVYLLRHEKHGSMKVGITNREAGEDRIRHFQKRGWTPLWTREEPLGVIALRVETEFFRFLRLQRGIPQHLDKETMGTSGYTETFSEEALARTEIISVLEELFEKYTQASRQIR